MATGGIGLRSPMSISSLGPASYEDANKVMHAPSFTGVYSRGRSFHLEAEGCSKWCASGSIDKGFVQLEVEQLGNADNHDMGEQGEKTISSAFARRCYEGAETGR